MYGYFADDLLAKNSESGSAIEAYPHSSAVRASSVELVQRAQRDPDGELHGFSAPTTHIEKYCEPPP